MSAAVEVTMEGLRVFHIRGGTVAPIIWRPECHHWCQLEHPVYHHTCCRCRGMDIHACVVCMGRV